MKIELRFGKRGEDNKINHLNRLSQGKVGVWDKVKECDRLASIATTPEEQLNAYKTPDYVLIENLQRSALEELTTLKNKPLK